MEKDAESTRLCAFCEFATMLPTSDGEDADVICVKRGVVRADYVCRKFRYDLLKRKPQKKESVEECYIAFDAEE